MKTPARKPAAPSQNAAKPAQAPKKNKNPGKEQRRKNRERRELGAVQIQKPLVSVNARKPVCSNPKFHPHHCDCPVHEDVLAFIDKKELLKGEGREQAAISAYVFHGEMPALKVIQPDVIPHDEPSKLPDLISGIIESERVEELLQKLRDAYCEVGHLKSKVKGQQKTIESLENQLQESRNARKGKAERRKATRNKRASDKAFNHGVMGVGRSDRDNWSQ
ncbi:hypothetical protein CNR33_00082 [Pseudomonas phage tabernarius]|uniref:Uncharacterized protein n=1 Tax=Pseudomonas phage tabernarius TaxID=2048978 RepID=A0A2H4P6Y0_9CAUD|nr:hypothetical protein FDJ17_gp82 [Pseudomonas phage tabernarius]ATW57928.1 hypothetical protein CNR33_00082 [Pseudomonas phage tabernarius]